MGKLIRAVLRGRNGGNTALLPDKYEQDGAPHKLYGFTAILSYSRMRFVTFVKRCDAQTLIRCLMEAFEYFGGLPKAALTDRMKSVLLLEMENKMPRWNPLFADFMASIGVAPRVCKAYTPQTKGKIERSVGFFKHSYWAGVSFTDIDDLNRQAHVWCERINLRVHRTTHERPRDRREQEPLAPLPQAFAWERFATEDGIRQLGWLPLLRWGALWAALIAACGRRGGPGTGLARDPQSVVWRAVACRIGEASGVPDPCRAS
jgi:hypothetical protein